MKFNLHKFVEIRRIPKVFELDENIITQDKFMKMSCGAQMLYIFMKIEVDC